MKKMAMVLVRIVCALVIFYAIFIKSLPQTHPKLYMFFMVMFSIYMIVSSIPSLIALNKEADKLLEHKD